MTTDREQVRQQVARRLAALHGYADDADLTGTDWLNQADAVLAVPAIADALTATEQLQRVRTLTEPQFDGDDALLVRVADIRAALDPPLEPSRSGQESQVAAEIPNGGTSAAGEIRGHATTPTPSNYVCPQCGPDPRGGDVHADERHTWPPRDDDYTAAAINRDQEQPRRRLRTCVENWPDAETGAYHPSCCRFPKSCSATVYDKQRVTDDDLEQP